MGLSAFLAAYVLHLIAAASPGPAVLMTARTAVTEGMRLSHFLEQLLPAQLERLVGAELGDQVVVVGVEPLGQFLGVLRLAMLTAAAGGRGTTGHGEQGVEGRQTAFVASAVETFRDYAECQRVAQHLVIPGKVADRQQINAGVFLQLPVGGAQITADLVQSSLVKVAFPEGFEGFFQFAVGANARETKGVGHGHVECAPLRKRWRHCRQPGQHETNSTFSC